MEKYSPDDLLRMLADVIHHGLPLRDINTLLRAGVMINGRVKNGLRPLHYAVFKNNGEVVRHLCDHGALVNLPDDIGKYAAHWGSSETADPQGCPSCSRLHFQVIVFFLCLVVCWARSGSISCEHARKKIIMCLY